MSPVHSPDHKHSSKYFNAFMLFPRSVRFESQKEDEHIILLVRAHPITFVPWIASAVFGALLPLILNFILPSFLEIRQIFFLNIFWYSILVTYVFMKLIFWLFNVGIVTNESIIDIDYFNIIQKSMHSTTLEEASDVGADVSGFIRSLFNYGNVSVQTAGPKTDIEFLGIPEPVEVSNIINELMK